MKLGLSFLAKAFFFSGLLWGGVAQAGIFPRTVSELDLERYVGKWYEVQSTQPFFQADCVCNTAEYSLRDDGSVNVVNSCNENQVDGPKKVVEGIAKPSRNPAKFYVQFGSFSSPVTNYWVIDVAPDYSYAVVSSFLRNPIWILSRTPSLPVETLNQIYSSLEKDGFDTSSLKETVQAGCSY